MSVIVPLVTQAMVESVLMSMNVVQKLTHVHHSLSVPTQLVHMNVLV